MEKNKTFRSPYEQYREHIGKPFEIISGPHQQDKESGEDIKLYKIKLSTGETIEAWPEEIFANQINS